MIVDNIFVTTANAYGSVSFMTYLFSNLVAVLEMTASATNMNNAETILRIKHNLFITLS